MKILPASLIDINAFKGAILINEFNTTYVCVGIGFALDECEVMFDLADDTGEYQCSVNIEHIKDWSVQFNSHPVQFTTDEIA
jgi:hypothetical protein